MRNDGGALRADQGQKIEAVAGSERLMQVRLAAQRLDELIADELHAQAIVGAFRILLGRREQRQHVREDFRRHARLVRNVSWRRMMHRRDQAPQRAVFHQRHHHGRLDAHVLEVAGIHHRNAAQDGVAHVDWLAGAGVIFRDERHRDIVDIRQMAEPAQTEHTARRGRDVGRGIMQPEVRFEIVALGLGNHVPAQILGEFVGHDPVVAGEGADLLHGEIEEVLQSPGRLKPRHGGPHMGVERAARQAWLP